MNRGWRTAAAVLLAAAVLAGTGLAAAGGAVRLVAASVHSRIAFGTWDPHAPPERIDYCSRRYDAGGSGTQTREASVAARDPAFAASWREVGRTDGGTPYYAMVVPDATRSAFHREIPCTMEVYLRVGPDAYRVYTLSGGP
jgi:hypothetical protein